MPDTSIQSPLDTWSVLRDARLLDAVNPLAKDFLDEMRSADKRNYTFIKVHVGNCPDFQAVAHQFNHALFNMTEFGGNADALFDILTDLPKGRYIFEVHGFTKLPKPIAAKLEGVLAAHRMGGVGYGEGEALFLTE